MICPNYSITNALYEALRANQLNSGHTRDCGFRKGHPDEIQFCSNVCKQTRAAIAQYEGQLALADGGEESSQ